MHFSELSPVEQRVLGCLIEKRWTTPDQYPLSLNALRLASNQLTNRDPVTDYDEATVREAAYRLSRYGLARMASGHGSRAVKYRHLAEEALGLGREELAVLAVLLLRGPQTPGELKARADRMASFNSLDDVDRVLGVLCERDYARRIPRRPGQKEDRFEHLLGGDDGLQASAEATTPPAVAAAPPPSAPPPSATGPAPNTSPDHTASPDHTPPPDHAPHALLADEPARGADDDRRDLTTRVTALEAELAELREELSELSARLVPDQSPPSEL